MHSLVVLRHANSLRALVKYLDNISDDEIPLVEIPTGDPLGDMLDGGMNAGGTGTLAVETGRERP